MWTTSMTGRRQRLPQATGPTRARAQRQRRSPRGQSRQGRSRDRMPPGRVRPRSPTTPRPRAPRSRRRCPPRSRSQSQGPSPELVWTPAPGQAWARAPGSSSAWGSGATSVSGSSLVLRWPTPARLDGEAADIAANLRRPHPRRRHRPLMGRPPRPASGCRSAASCTCASNQVGTSGSVAPTSPPPKPSNRGTPSHPCLHRERPLNSETFHTHASSC